MRPLARWLAAVLLLALAACSSDGGRAPAGEAGPGPAANGGDPAGAPPARAPVAASSPVYVAVGASETVGIGAEVPLRDAWPRVLFRTAMPENTVFVNMGIPGATVAQALQQEVPRALELEPTIVTVWLNVNDIIAGVTPEEFERDLGSLVHQLRRDGSTRVLVANTPPIDHLPAYRACRPDPPATAPGCRREGFLPPPDVVNGIVADYNQATSRVVEREGANLVDLHAVGMRARQAGIADALISPDGFHPNAGGYQMVATAFAEVLRSTGPLR